VVAIAGRRQRLRRRKGVVDDPRLPGSLGLRWRWRRRRRRGMERSRGWTPSWEWRRHQAHLTAATALLVIAMRLLQEKRAMQKREEQRPPAKRAAQRVHTGGVLAQVAYLMCAGCGLHNAWDHGHILKEMEEVIRPCGLPHQGLWMPTLRNTHQSLLACQQRALIRVSTRYSTKCGLAHTPGLSHFESARTFNPYDHSRNRAPLRFALWI
jgi:hypothetical protein